MLTDALDRLPVVTILVIIYAIAGAAVVVFHPETLDFEKYLTSMSIAAAGLGIGRGIASGSKTTVTGATNVLGLDSFTDPVVVQPGEGDPLPESQAPAAS